MHARYSDYLLSLIAIIPAMTNHNDIWYESGRAARYGGEPKPGTVAFYGILLINVILHQSTMPHLQLFCDDWGLCLRSAKDNGDGTWIELEKTNEKLTINLTNLVNLVKLEVCGIGWTGFLPNYTAVLCNFTELVHLDVSSNQLTGPLSTVLSGFVFCYPY